MRRLAAALTAVLVLGGCGTADQAGTDPQPSGHSTRPVDHLRVGLTEWKIVTSAQRVEPGKVNLRVTNTGATTHDLYIRGEDGTWHTHHLDPGERQHLVVHASPGEDLTLWCSLTGHDSSGMHTTLHVTSD